jgi:hypothetical protein
MDLGDKIGFLIDNVCKKKNNQVVEVREGLLKKLVRILF